jgi:tetratricopeptide (TPR) repeat protein
LEQLEQEVGALVGSARRDCPELANLRELSKAGAATKFYFLSRILGAVQELQDAPRSALLRLLVDLNLDSPPWNMPPEVAAMVRFSRAELSYARSQQIHQMQAPTSEDIALSKADGESALADYQAVLSAVPKTPWGRRSFLQVTGLLEPTNRHDAIALYRAYLDANPSTEERELILLNEGKCLLMVKDYSTAVDKFTQVLREHPAGRYAGKAHQYRKYARKKMGGEEQSGAKEE